MAPQQAYVSFKVFYNGKQIPMLCRGRLESSDGSPWVATKTCEIECVL